MSAVVPRGALTAGQGQWFGVAVSPLHDVLAHAQLRLSLAQHGSPIYGGATNYAGAAECLRLPMTIAGGHPMNVLGIGSRLSGICPAVNHAS